MSGLRHPVERRQVILDCGACGNPSGGFHAPGCTAARRREHALRQTERMLDAGKAEEVDALSATITRLVHQIGELSAVRDELSRQVWGCTYAELA
jgi:hypothetical protein